jgi:hypothetical protein
MIPGLLLREDRFSYNNWLYSLWFFKTGLWLLKYGRGMPGRRADDGADKGLTH